jgi:hypothetical protein
MAFLWSGAYIFEDNIKLYGMRMKGFMKYGIM